MKTELLQQEDHSLEILKAYQVIEKKNKDFIDGLYYASFVQQGMMPQERHFNKNGYPYFILYSPLQIIGGDFFWLGKKSDWCFYAVGDCTGHGVGGAILSTLAIGFLNYLVYSKEYFELADILNEIDKKWIETFKRHEDDAELNNDWMEISLMAYNNKTGEFQFAGANSSILITGENRNPIVLHGNSFPIGGWQIENNRRFTTNFLKFNDTVKVYMYSDGYKDQFGGPNNKKLGTKNFRELLVSLSTLSVTDQKEHLQKYFQQWKNNNEQTDDVCLLGIQFN